ncbi:EpsG family protein [Fusobacterium mortiferum]|jgi:hypothetical protein|uniref:EpsG family protein n=1 Tax=Fusobacterium mortiferum TaxID=850 RepID=UPI001F226CCD|nr:EpsG family protein [Fusobacterium mortiferum]
MFYIVLYFIVIILLYRKKFLYLNVLLVLLIGFRYNVGTDYWNYTNNFLYQNIFAYEVGFKLLNKLLFLFTSNSQVLFLCSGIISIFFMWKGIKNYNIDNRLLYYIYFCMYFIEPNFNLTRHGIAMSISYYALSVKNNYKRFLLILFASVFHKVALVLIIIILFKRVNIRYYIIFLLSSILIYFLDIDILKILYENNLIISDYLKWKIKVYMYTRELSDKNITIGIVYRLILLLICLINLKLWKKNQEIIKILIASNISFFILSINGVFYERVANLLYLFEINILAILFLKKNIIAKIFIVILVTLFYLKISFKENTEKGQFIYQKKYKYIPYKMKLINKETNFEWKTEYYKK